MAFNPNELVRVGQANTRTTTSTRVVPPLTYSPKVQKFRVSPNFYHSANIQDNGLTLYEDKKGNRLVLAIEPNEKAVMHRGKEGFKKGREFTSSRMRMLLDQYGFSQIDEFELEDIQGGVFFEIKSDQEKSYADKDAEAPIDAAIPVQESELPQSPGPEDKDVFGDMRTSLDETEPAQDDAGPQEEESEEKDIFGDFDDPKKKSDHDDLDSLLG